MATPAYVRELQQTSQPQTGAVTSTTGQPATVTVAPQQFLAELQMTGASAAPPAGRTTPPPAQVQKSPAIVQAPPTQAPSTQYVTAEIQSSPTQSSNDQNTPQYIVVTVTEGSLHSSDSVSDSSPPSAIVQTGVPTQVVQQVQTAQQRSVVQATTQTTKTEPGTQLNVTNLQSVHLPQEVQQQLQQVPVQHVYTNQVQYVEGGDTNYQTSTIRSGSFPYTETPLYTQTTAGQYYETTPASGSEATSPGTPLTVSVTTGSPGVSMYVTGTGQIVANPTSATGGGVTAVVASSGAASNGSGESGSEANGSGASYVIQGGYMLAGSGSGSSSSGNGYTHPTRASPATVSINEGEDNSVPSADKKV